MNRDNERIISGQKRHAPVREADKKEMIGQNSLIKAESVGICAKTMKRTGALHWEIAV